MSVSWLAMIASMMISDSSMTESKTSCCLMEAHLTSESPRQGRFFGTAVQALGDAGLIAPEYYDLERPVLVLDQQGSGSTEPGAPVITETIQYRYMALRLVNGVPFANAGVRVAVHRSGKIASIRLGGATIASVGPPGEERGTGTSYAIKRMIALDELSKKHDAEAAQGSSLLRTVRSQFVYMIPPNEAHAHPVQHFSYVLVFGSDGDISISRRQDRAYPIDTVDPAFHDLTPSASPNDSGDSR
jgi:hypothetical protein